MGVIIKVDEEQFANMPEDVANENIHSLADGLIPESEIQAIIERIGVRRTSRVSIGGIPGWANWKESDVDDWRDDNIKTPLADARTLLSGLSGQLTMAIFKNAMGRILDILDAMLVMLTAISKIIIFMRNKNWPDAQRID